MEINSLGTKIGDLYISQEKCQEV